MTHAFPTYPAYLDSGVDWLGQIPTHWKASTVGRHFNVELGKMLNRAAEDGTGIVKPYVRAANVHWSGVELDSAGVNEMEFSPRQLERYRLRPGDLLVTEGGVTVGRSVIWRGELEECYYQNSLNRARALPGSPLSAKYLYYWMYFTTQNGYVDLVADKATFQHLTNKMLLAFHIVVPGASEQRAIAAFLDRETARLDALIAKEERLLALLAEKRAALISHAVTKGLDPSVPMRDSGVAWLGDIPAHWEASTVGRHFGVELGKMLNRSSEDGTGIVKPYVRAANVHWNGVELDNAGVNEMEFSSAQLERYRLRPGDLLVTEGGVTVGRSVIWSRELEECYYQNSLNRARVLPGSPLSTKYLYYWMYFTTTNGYVDLVAAKATFQHLTNKMLSAFPIVVPDASEQRAIAVFLNGETAKLDALSAKVRAAIDKLREYRAALISAAVTGKIDVRRGEAVHE